MSNWIRLLAAAVALAASGVAASAQTVPPLSLESLSGNEVEVPSGLPGRVNLLILAFEREQQPDADTWLGRAESLRRDSDGAFDYFELPVIGRANFALRFVIDNGMRSGIPEGPAQDRVLTVYDGAEDLMAALGDPSESTIHVLLIDRAGDVLWSASGPATDDDDASLREAVAGAL